MDEKKEREVPKDLSDEGLLHRIKEYDPAALEELHRRHSEFILGFLGHLLGNQRDEAEELADEVWLQICRRTFEFTKQASVKTWLGGIAKNVARQYWTRRVLILERERQIPTQVDEDEVVREVEFADPAISISSGKLDTDALLIAAVDSLPRAERAAVWLTVRWELLDVAAATILDCSEKRVKEYRSRGLAGIRSFLIAKLERVQNKGRGLPMTSHERNERLIRLIQSMPERDDPGHGALRYVREVEEMNVKINGWITELDCVINESDHTDGQESDRSLYDSE